MSQAKFIALFDAQRILGLTKLQVLSAIANGDLTAFISIASGFSSKVVNWFPVPASAIFSALNESRDSFIFEPSGQVNLYRESRYSVELICFKKEDLEVFKSIREANRIDARENKDQIELTANDRATVKAANHYLSGLHLAKQQKLIRANQWNISELSKELFADEESLKKFKVDGKTARGIAKSLGKAKNLLLEIPRQ